MRVERGSGEEYEALQMAGLLRKLLLDAPIIHAVNRSRKLTLVFRLRDEDFDPAWSDWMPGEFIYPGTDGGLDLTFEQFVRRVVMVTARERVTVRDLIRFFAHNYGGIHASAADTAAERAIRDAAWGGRYSTPVGSTQLR